MAKQALGRHTVEAFRPTTEQREDFTFPPYAEIVLRIGGVEVYLDAQTSWDIRDALAKATLVNGGRSIVEAVEEELDVVVDRIMTDGADGPDPNEYGVGYDDEETYSEFRADEYKEDCKAWGESRGQAQGLAYAAALMRGCSVDAIREQAMERYDTNSGG